MERIFLTVLRMSLTGGAVTLAVLLAGWLLRRFRAPAVLCYLLWGVVLFRLLCPVAIPVQLPGLSAGTVSSAVSAPGLPVTASPDPEGAPAVEGSAAASPAAPAPAEESLSPRAVLSLVWLCGALLVAGYGLLSYLRLRRKLATAVRLTGNLYESDRISTPFVCGLFRPKIYLPLDLPEREARYVLAHERTHIRRRDYLVKPLFFAALALHWFNPLVYLAFLQMSRDMELSCDEAVLRKSPEWKLPYSYSLLRFAAAGSRLSFGPIAFGESGAKRRIRHALSYRRPRKAAAVCFSVLTALLFAACAAEPQSAPREPGGDHYVFSSVLLGSVENGEFYSLREGPGLRTRSFTLGEVLAPDSYRLLTAAGEQGVSREVTFPTLSGPGGLSLEQDVSGLFAGGEHGEVTLPLPGTLSPEAAALPLPQHGCGFTFAPGGEENLPAANRTETLAVSGEGELLPAAVAAASPTPEMESALRKELLAHGLSKMEPYFHTVLRADFDGDGQEELFALAGNERNESGFLRIPGYDGGAGFGVYSAALYLDAGKVAVFSGTYLPLEDSAALLDGWYPGATYTALTLVATADLNGDGTLEPVLRQTGWEWSAYTAYSLQNGAFVPVLYATSGL